MPTININRSSVNANTVQPRTVPDPVNYGGLLSAVGGFFAEREFKRLDAARQTQASVLESQYLRDLNQLSIDTLAATDIPTANKPQTYMSGVQKLQDDYSTKVSQTLGDPAYLESFRAQATKYALAQEVRVREATMRAQRQEGLDALGEKERSLSQFYTTGAPPVRKQVLQDITAQIRNNAYLTDAEKELRIDRVREDFERTRLEFLMESNPTGALAEVKESTLITDPLLKASLESKATAAMKQAERQQIAESNNVSAAAKEEYTYRFLTATGVAQLPTDEEIVKDDRLTLGHKNDLLFQIKNQRNTVLQNSLEAPSDAQIATRQASSASDKRKLDVLWDRDMAAMEGAPEEEVVRVLMNRVQQTQYVPKQVQKRLTDAMYSERPADADLAVRIANDLEMVSQGRYDPLDFMSDTERGRFEFFKAYREAGVPQLEIQRLFEQNGALSDEKRQKRRAEALTVITPLYDGVLPTPLKQVFSGDMSVVDFITQERSLSNRPARNFLAPDNYDVYKREFISAYELYGDKEVANKIAQNKLRQQYTTVSISGDISHKAKPYRFLPRTISPQDLQEQFRFTLRQLHGETKFDIGEYDVLPNERISKGPYENGYFQAYITQKSKSFGKDVMLPVLVDGQKVTFTYSKAAGKAVSDLLASRNLVEKTESFLASKFNIKDRRDYALEEWAKLDTETKQQYINLWLRDIPAARQEEEARYLAEYGFSLNGS